MNKKKNSNTNNLLIFSMIILTFISPVLISAAFYFNQGWLPQHTMNKGAFASQKNLNLVITDNLLNHKWSLLYIGNNKTQIITTLDLFARMLKILAKDNNRVDIILLQSKNLLTEIPTNPQLQCFNLDFNTSTFHELFNYPEYAIYLVDPKHTIILKYRITDDPKHILNDLKRLLKASQIG